MSQPPRKTPGVFNIAAVGVVRNYPATLKAFEARKELLKANRDKAEAAGTQTRLNVPNGYTRKTADRQRVVAEREAKRIVRAMPSAPGGPLLSD